MPDASPDGARTYLCFDYGLRRIGVAVGQGLTGTASALEVVARHDSGAHFDRIEQLLHQWHPHALVVGVPLTEDGKTQPMTRQARRFAAALAERFGLPVFEADERYSSREAQKRFREQRSSGSARRSQASREDAVAAQIILESWIAERGT